MDLQILALLTQKHGIEARKAASTKGGEYHSACPGCGGRDRFHIWPDQNDGEGSYWCRGCGKSGDNIQFLMDFSGMDFKAACQYLEKPLNAGTPQTFKRPRPAPPKLSERPGPPPSLWGEKAQKFVDWSHEYLMGFKPQLKWLSRRGIKKETAEKYRLGWNRGDDSGKDLYRHREAWGLETELKKDGKKKKLWLPVGLVIPFIKDAAVQRVRIRRPAAEPPRYYVLPGSSSEQMFLNGTNFIVVESELDFILLDQEVRQAFGIGLLSLGTSAAKPDEETHRHLQTSGMILNALDYDEAGSKGFEWWEKTYPQVKRWPVPVGKDPGESYQAGVDLKAWIEVAFPKGWTVGPIRLGSLEAKGRPLEPGKDLPPAVIRLAELLEKHPVMIQVTPHRLRLLEPRKWSRENWETSKEISNLVYFNADVMAYLSNHPESMISGKNFMRRV